MDKKIALVLEGGGMRGAYTAGCLSWLIKENIKFDSHYGISTGAVYLCSYLLGEQRYLYELSNKYIAGKEAIGLNAFLREGRIVAYDYLFDYMLPQEFGFDNAELLEVGKTVDAKIGLYSLNECKTVYRQVKDLDINMQYLKASASLPIIGKPVEIDGVKYLDGGITDMIPIQEAINDNNTNFLIITTKPKGYVRKAANKFLTTAMKMSFPDYPQIYEDYKIRHLNYAKQIHLIENEVDHNKAIYMYPSETIDVSRLKGDPDDLQRLYDLGISDMEKRCEDIFTMMQK